MCRVRFGLTGIYFDSLEPSRPREDFFQPLIASVPPILQNKQGDAGLEAINGGEIQEKVATEVPKNNQDGPTKNPSDSSSFRAEGCRSTKKIKPIHASVASKQERNSVSSSSSSASSLLVSSLPSSDEELANSRNKFQAPKPPKRIDLRTTQRRHRKSTKRHTGISPGGLTRPPPAKRVRFAMDEEKTITPSHTVNSTSSSHSSDDSYTDPPSPTEPCDAFGGYYRTPGVSKSYDTNGQVAGWRMQVPAGLETDMNIYDGFLDSEDGSEVDVQALPVRRRLRKTVQANVRDPDQRHHQNNAAPNAGSKQSGRIMDQFCAFAENDESIVDKGLRSEKSHANRKQPVSRHHSREQLRYPKLRSGKDLPEPIFVVRPRFLLHAKEKEKQADRFSSGGYSRDVPEKKQEGRKASSSRPTR